MNFFWFVIFGLVALSPLLNMYLERIFEREYNCGILSWFDYNSRDILRKGILILYFLVIFLICVRYALNTISHGIQSLF